MDDDGQKIAVQSPNPNCPYCRGELTVAKRVVDDDGKVLKDSLESREEPNAAGN